MKNLFLFRFSSLFLLILFYISIQACSTSGSPASDPILSQDSDGDGVYDTSDCLPNDASISPDKVEVLADGIDQDCSGSDKIRIRSIESHNIDGNGTIDYTRKIDYDSAGNEIKIVSESAGVMGIEENSYNAQNKLILRKVDSDGDGTVNHIFRYSYNDQGKLLLEENDYGNDGTIEYKYVYEYDASGNALNIKSYSGATFTREIINTYSPEGFWLSSLNKQYSPFVSNTLSVYTNNAQGHRTESVTTTDGITVVHDQMVYDSEGRMIVSREDNGTPVDGIWNRIRYFAYNPDGSYISIQVDGSSGGPLVSDGIIDFIAHYDSETLANGNIKHRSRSDHDNNGSIDSMEYSILNNQEKYVEMGRDIDGNGLLDFKQNYDYNEFHLTTQSRQDTDGNGTTDYEIRWEYSYNE